MGKVENQRAFKQFVGETVKEYIQKVIDEQGADKKKKTSWGGFFKNVFDKHYNNIAMAKYKEIMKDFPQPKEGEDMVKFITENFDKDEVELYERVKNIRYTAPDGKPSNVNKNFFQTLVNDIVGYVTNDTAPTYMISKDSQKMNDYLTNIYKTINGENARELEYLEDVYKRINMWIQAHRKTDEHNSAIRLKREVKRAEKEKENEKMEALDKQKKEHEEDKRKLQVEHNADKLAATAYIRNKTQEEMKKQKQYKDEFIDDDRDNHPIVPLPDDESSEEVITEEDKAMKAAQNIHNKLQEDTLITRAAIDNTFYNQLPDEIKQSLRPKIEEKKAIIERSKVIRYLLPKERPKWTNATMSKGVNPLLSRGAWGI